jgi:hypothetical protein
MTRKGAAPIKLWFDSHDEMNVLSNKRQAIQDIFKTIDTNKIGRIDTMELFAPIIISIQGKWETILAITMVIFGFGDEGEFSRDEFHFFLDCLFRGLFKLLIPTTPSCPKSKNRKQPHPGRKLPSIDIERLVA